MYCDTAGVLRLSPIGHVQIRIFIFFEKFRQLRRMYAFSSDPCVFVLAGNTIYIGAGLFLSAQHQEIGQALLRKIHVDINLVIKVVLIHRFSVCKILFTECVEQFCKFLPLFCVINVNIIVFKRRACASFNPDIFEVLCLYIVKESSTRIAALRIYNKAYTGAEQCERGEDCDPDLRFLERRQCFDARAHFFLSADERSCAEKKAFSPRRGSDQCCRVSLFVPGQTRRVVVAVDFHVAAKSAERQPNHRIPPERSKHSRGNKIFP